MEEADVAVIGAGAAGLMAAIWAGRTQPQHTVVALDGARRLGAKILVAGGGRCNVTHDRVDERAYAGASRHAIRKVLRRFDVPQTISFFQELGVELKREESGKLFPVSDKAQTILSALLSAAQQAGVDLRHPCRVQTVTRAGDFFLVQGDWGGMRARRLILATGGKSLPRSGSDGQGYSLAQALGHHLTPHIVPALVPLTLPRDHFLCGLSGVTLRARLDLWAANGTRLASFTDSTLCTHFGLSGPSVLDISRYYLVSQMDDAGAHLTINWLPDMAEDQIEADLLALGRQTIQRYLHNRLPERLWRALLDAAGIDPLAQGSQLARGARRTLLQTLTRMPLPVTGSRGFTYAEVTAGGVPLSELHLETMESRICAGLHLCGEICDVDGRIGGYNFQWAWASGYVAGVSVG